MLIRGVSTALDESKDDLELGFWEKARKFEEGHSLFFFLVFFNGDDCGVEGFLKSYDENFNNNKRILQRGDFEKYPILDTMIIYTPCGVLL